MAVLRNIAFVLRVYLSALLPAHCILPVNRLCAFAFLALPGVAWAVVDAVELAGLKHEAAHHAAVLGGIVAVTAMSIAVVVW